MHILGKFCKHAFFCLKKNAHICAIENSCFFLYIFFFFILVKSKIKSKVEWNQVKSRIKSSQKSSQFVDNRPQIKFEAECFVALNFARFQSNIVEIEKREHFGTANNLALSQIGIMIRCHSLNQGKHEIKYFLISENQRPCGWKKPKITVFHLSFLHWKHAFPCLKSSQMSSILIQNLSNNILLLPEIVLDTLDVCYGRLERKENTK